MPSIEGFIPVVYPYNENRKTTRKITVEASFHTKNYLGSIVSHDMNPTIISNMNHIYMKDKAYSFFKDDQNTAHNYWENRLNI